MPIVIAGAAIDALAFGLIAIVAGTLIITYVVTPLRAAAAFASSIVAIGGALSWALTHAANFVQSAVDANAHLVEIGRNQALAYWNWLVGGTVNALFADQWALLYATASTAVQALASTTYIWTQYLPWLRGRVDANEANANAATHLAQRIWYQDLPQIRGIDDILRRDVDAATRLAQDIWYNQLPFMRGVEAGIRADLNAVGQLAQADAHAIAQTQAATTAVATAVRAIEQSPCQRFCDPLGDLGQLLQGLQDAGMLAIMLALVQEALHDPAGLEAEIAEVIVPSIRSAVSSLGLGIPER